MFSSSSSCFFVSQVEQKTSIRDLWRLAGESQHCSTLDHMKADNLLDSSKNAVATDETT